MKNPGKIRFQSRRAWNLHCGTGWVWVSGYTFTVPGWPGFRFGVDRRVGQDAPYPYVVGVGQVVVAQWVVTELVSGYAVGTGGTRQAAVLTLLRNLAALERRYKNPQRWLARKVRKLNGWV